MKTIPLTQGQVAFVDDDDYEAVNAHKWCAYRQVRRFYATRRIRKLDGKGATQTMHRFLMPGVPEIHHLDGDGLNNQRGNLRSVTRKQNLRGACRKRPGATSKFRGVCWSKQKRKWEAGIKVDGKDIYLGRFSDEADAARAYDAAARKYFGEFACPNFP